MAPIEHVADTAVPMSFQMGEEGSSYNWNTVWSFDHCHFYITV